MKQIKKKKRKKKTERAELIEECEKLIREGKFRTFGRKCQFCNRTTSLGLFHILSKGAHPRIRLHEDNLLISCWLPCHYTFHHDPFFARDVIFPKIVQICGETWEQDLLELERSEPKLGIVRLREIREELKEKYV